MHFGSPSSPAPESNPSTQKDFWFPATVAREPVRVAARRQRAGRRAAFLLALDYLESRLMMAGPGARLILPTLPDPLTSVGASPNPSIKVTIVDVTGALATTDNSTVVLTLAQNPAGGSLTVNGRAVGSVTATAVAGIATFSNLSFSVPGQYVINVNDGSMAGTQSNVFTVLPIATHLVFQVQPSPISAGTAFNPVVQVLVEDANNNIVTTDSRAISLTLNNSSGTLTGGTITNAVNGIATFTGLSVSSIGTFTLTARDTATSGGLTSISSTSFLVSAGPPAKVVFGTPPTNTPANITLTPVVVDITDSAGNIVTTANSSVTLTILSGPSGATVLGTTTVNAVNGVATFSDLSFPTTGNYTLQATSGSLNAAVSSSFAITGPATQLAFLRGPVQTTVGSIMSPGVIVAVEDSNGNIVTNDSSNVTITIGSGPGTLSGTTTVQVVNGTASFNDLAFSALGTYTLSASDGALTDATSSSFIINGTAAQLAFIVLPGANEANSPLSPGIVVEVEDINGNRVVNDTSVISISLGSGPGLLSGTTQTAAVDGRATFSNLKLSTSGTYTLSAADATHPSVTHATSDNIVVLPAASQLVFLQQPSSVASGSTMVPSVVIQVQNSLGQVATTNTSQVTLVLVSGPHNGTIGGTTTVSAVAGVATFSNLRFGVPGTYKIMAVDGTLGTAISRTFTVTEGAKQLQWAAQPVGPIAAGASLNNISAWVEDRNGNPVPSNVVITLGISQGPTGGAIVGNATATAVNGVVKFSGISFTETGTYVLTVTGTGLRAAVSKKFDVIAAATTSQLVVTSSPASVLVGKNLPDVIVKVEDQFGNVIKSNNSPVTLSLVGTTGTLIGTKTVMAKNGAAVFHHLSMNTVGTFTITATDNALANPTTSFALTVSPVTTIVSTPTHASQYAVNAPITLTTHLSGLVNSPVAWTGNVRLVDAANNTLDTVAVNSGGNATFHLGGQTAGIYSLHVVYDGDANHLSSVSGPFSLTVGAGTTVKVTASSKNVASGDTVTLNIKVSAANGSNLVRTGTVTLMEGSTVLSSTSLDSNSAATLTPSFTAGTHTLTVVYSGDTNFRSSTSSVLTIKATDVMVV